MWNLLKCAEHMWIYAKLCKSLHISIYASLKMPLFEKNMRYVDFCKICDICCDHMIAINRHP